ncbi:MAG: hypothetical protein ACRELG_20370 [Gemmataceae bacterium]
MKNGEQQASGAPGPTAPIPPPLAPILMIAFWMLLGGAAGIKLAQSVWQLLGWGAGDVSIAVPVGGVIGALAGALLGLISNPRLLVLLMAVFAGASAGAVAGKLPWGEIGEIGGQISGGLVGGMAWAVWLFFGGRAEEFTAPTHKSKEKAPRP